MKKENLEIINLKDGSSVFTGVIYDKNNLKCVMSELVEKINNRLIYGEIIHSNNPSNNVFLENVSHAVTNIKFDDDILSIDIETLNTTMGVKLAEIIDHVRFVPRMVGNVNDDGTINIDRIFTFDAVWKEQLLNGWSLKNWVESLKHKDVKFL